MYNMCLTKREVIKVRKSRLRRKKVKMIKRIFKEFWKEWGISWEEFEMLIGAAGVLLFPFFLRIVLAFFGI